MHYKIKKYQNIKLDLYSHSFIICAQFIQSLVLHVKIYQCLTAFPNELFYLFSELFFSNSDSNIGLIVGATVGGVIFLIIVIIVVIVFCIKKPKRK